MFLLNLLLLPTAFADAIYTCKLTTFATIVWENAGVVSKAKLKGKGGDEDENLTVVFVVKKDGALLKGNAGQAKLKRVGGHSFIETTEVGNVNLWTLFEKTDAHQSVLIQHKAYSLVTPSSYTHGYICD